MGNTPGEAGRKEESDAANLDLGHETEEVKVTDRRRVKVDGEPIDENEVSVEGTSKEEANLLERLADAEAKRQEAERQVADFADRFRKAQVQMRAENDELRQRLQRNFEQRLDAARGDLVASLLDSLDNIKRAVAASENSEGEKGVAALIEGVRATADIFETRLKALGLTAVESLGAEFNPEIHEAVEIVPATEEDDNRVVGEMQPGYRLGDRLLRPARVKVGRYMSS